MLGYLAEFVPLHGSVTLYEFDVPFVSLLDTFLSVILRSVGKYVIPTRVLFVTGVDQSTCNGTW